MIMSMARMAGRRLVQRAAEKEAESVEARRLAEEKAAKQSIQAKSRSFTPYVSFPREDAQETFGRTAEREMPVDGRYTKEIKKKALRVDSVSDYNSYKTSKFNTKKPGAEKTFTRNSAGFWGESKEEFFKARLGSGIYQSLSFMKEEAGFRVNAVKKSEDFEKSIKEDKYKKYLEGEKYPRNVSETFEAKKISGSISRKKVSDATHLTERTEDAEKLTFGDRLHKGAITALKWMTSETALYAGMSVVGGVNDSLKEAAADIEKLTMLNAGAVQGGSGGGDSFMSMMAMQSLMNPGEGAKPKDLKGDEEGEIAEGTEKAGEIGSAKKSREVPTGGPKGASKLTKVKSVKV